MSKLLSASRPKNSPPDCFLNGLSSPVTCKYFIMTRVTYVVSVGRRDLVFGSSPPVIPPICALPKNDSPNHFYLRISATSRFILGTVAFKSRPLHCFVKLIKGYIPSGYIPLSMVRVTGLEPVRQRHTPLKRACLPIPAHSHIEQSNYSIFLFDCQYLILSLRINPALSQLFL